jgi:uncharacterized Zn-finger protein
MHSGSDMGGPGFSSRRPNASTLPNFELPPPPLSNSQKYHFAVSGAGQPGSLASVGNLLTPPSTIESGGSVSSSSAPSASSYTNGGYSSWSPSQQTHPTYYTQTGSTQNFTQAQRVPYSSASTIVRGQPHSPPSSEGGQIANYDLPPFPSTTPLTPATLPSMAPQQPQSQQQQALQSQLMGSSTPVSQTTQPSPVHAQEAFRAPPTPTFYSAQSTPQTATFPYTTGPSAQVTPLSVSGSMSGRPQMSPATTGPMPLPAPPVQSPHTYQGRFASYGPVMSNMHNPGGQPIMVGGLAHGMMAGFNSGHAASMQTMYGTPTPQSTQVADRPFKCDECPQSFNRNHDLKRHKRIHLAVKPFPCAHCDKSFSRKDALKVSRSDQLQT